MRVMAMMWAVLQFALPAVATIADGALERMSVGASAAHVESSSTASCHPAHSAECALCQFLSRPMTSSAPVTLPPVATLLVARVADTGEGHAASALARLPGARAPPMA